MKCLIVAAGQGVRLREKGGVKPLIRINGVPLIERVIDHCRTAGFEEFYVVSGYRGTEVRSELELFSAKHDDLHIVNIVNDDWERANGVSVLKAKPYMDGPFLLTMCDHLVDPGILQAVARAPAERGTVTLCVDYNVSSPLNDPEDVTRVRCLGTRITRVGKVIRDFNAIDTGVFWCDPIMFDALEASQTNGDDSISGAMNVLASWGRARAFDVGARVWIDVDDPRAFHKAEGLVEAGRL